MNILLVEDDPMIGDSVQRALSNEQMQVQWLQTGENVETVVKESGADAILLDLNLPRRSGLEVLRSLRASRDSIPVLVITARDSVSEVVNSLNSGADDYMIKPFDLDELVARLRALVRRSKSETEQIYRRDGVELRPKTREATVNGEPVTLSAREWSIMETLISRPGAVYSRSMLEDRLYGASGDIESNVIEVHVHSLRKKLGHGLIMNIRGVGYMVARSK